MGISRRFFVLGTTGLVVASGAGPTIFPAAYANDTPLLFQADMEASQFSDYSESGISASGNSPVLTKERARRGAQSARIYLNRKTSSNSFRTEASTAKNQLQFRRTHWIGFSVFAPDSWQISNTWEVLFQVHDHPVDWNIAFNPIFAIRIRENTDRWLLEQRYVQVPEGEHTKADQRTAFSTLHGAIKRGAWTDFVIEYRPDWRDVADGGVGVTRVWQNRSLITDYRGPNAYNQSNSPYLKFGCYKSAWKDRDRSDPVTERLYFMDEFRVSRPDAGSYELVDPAASDLAPAPAAPHITSVS